jgi:hypothetical protein
MGERICPQNHKFCMIKLLMKIAILGVDSRVVAWVREFLVGCLQRVRIGRQLSEEVSNVRGTAREHIGPTSVPCIHK